MTLGVSCVPQLAPSSANDKLAGKTSDKMTMHTAIHNDTPEERRLIGRGLSLVPAFEPVQTGPPAISARRHQPASSGAFFVEEQRATHHH